MKFTPLLLALSFLLSTAYSEELFQADLNGEATPWTRTDFADPSETIRFAVIGDFQGGGRPADHLRALEMVNLMQPEFAINIGDVIPGYTSDIEQLRKQWDDYHTMLKKCSMPFFLIPGNHDVANANQLKIWNELHGRNYYAFRYRNVLFLVLDSFDAPDNQPTKGFQPGYGDEQLAYMAAVLKANPEVRHIFVFTHVPMWNPSMGMLHYWDRFLKTIGDRPFTAFAGHTHVSDVRRGTNGMLYTLSVTGGSPEKGEVDNILWITLIGDRLSLVKLKIDGISSVSAEGTEL